MKRVLVITGCLFSLFFAACTKELSTDFNQYPTHPMNDTVWVRTVANTASIHDLAQLLAPTIYTVDSVDISQDFSLNFGDSLDIAFTGGSFLTSTGTAASGKAKLELYRVRKKGDFIKLFKPTSTTDSILTSQGTFFIRLSKDTKELSLAPGATIRLRFADPDMQPASTGVLPYYGREGNPTILAGIDTSFSWNLFENAYSNGIKPYQKQTTGGTIKGYEVISKYLHWISAQNILDTMRINKSKITTILPLNYTNKNTVVFAVFAERKSVVNLKADFTSRTFSGTNFPAKAKIKLVSISKIGDDLYLSSKDILDPGAGAIYSLTPEKKSIGAILQFLDGL